MAKSVQIRNNLSGNLLTNFNAELKCLNESTRIFQVLNHNPPDPPDFNCNKWFNDVRKFLEYYENENFVRFEFQLEPFFNCSPNNQKNVAYKDTTCEFFRSVKHDYECLEQANSFYIEFGEASLTIYGYVTSCRLFKEQVIETKLKRAHGKILTHPAFALLKFVDESTGNYILNVWGRRLRYESI
jgi:hypothetical protein